MLFGSALLLASVRAQSSFTHSNHLIPNSVTALSVATGGTLNLLAPLAATSCPEIAAADGDTRNDDGSGGRIHNYAERDCDNHTSGNEDVETDKGKTCVGQVEELAKISDSEVEEKGKCETEDGEKDDFVMIIICKVPLAPNAYVITRTSPAGLVSRISGMLIDGYVQM